MASVYLSTADAVVAAINAGTFNRSFAAVRGFDVTADLRELYGQVRVDVVPSPLTNKTDSRGGIAYFPSIDVGVRYKFTRSDEGNQGDIQLDEIDPYIELLEQINEHLLSHRYRRLPTYRDAGLLGSEIKAPWIAAHLKSGMRQYTGILRFNYLVEKERA